MDKDKQWEVYLLYIGFALPIIANIIYQAAYTLQTDPNKMAAVGSSVVYSTVPVLLLFIFLFRKFLHGIEFKSKPKAVSQSEEVIGAPIK